MNINCGEPELDDLLHEIDFRDEKVIQQEIVEEEVEEWEWDIFQTLLRVVPLNHLHT